MTDRGTNIYGLAAVLTVALAVATWKLQSYLKVSVFSAKAVVRPNVNKIHLAEGQLIHRWGRDAWLFLLLADFISVNFDLWIHKKPWFYKPVGTKWTGLLSLWTGKNDVSYYYYQSSISPNICLSFGLLLLEAHLEEIQSCPLTLSRDFVAACSDFLVRNVATCFEKLE